MTPALRDGYLLECRELVVEYLRDTVSRRSALSADMLEYPLREAKGLRPALCIATCRALGGGLEEAIPTAAAIELYHNAFLIHDDVEDGSVVRRDRPTLHQQIGEPAAINVGDAMLAVALQPLLENTSVLDLGRALRILEHIAAMAYETAAGQALELDWIRAARWDVTEDDYVTMVTKKTALYSFVTPIVCGGIIARASKEWLASAASFAVDLGVAFQIRDDLLNIAGEPGVIGKDWCGDLWEGKRTLLISGLFERASRAQRERAQVILRKPRPRAGSEDAARVESVLPELVSRGVLSSEQLGAVVEALRQRATEREKTREDVAELLSMLTSLGIIDEVSRRATDLADAARRRWSEIESGLSAGVHRDLLESLIDYVTKRVR